MYHSIKLIPVLITVLARRLCICMVLLDRSSCGGGASQMMQCGKWWPNVISGLNDGVLGQGAVIDVVHAQSRVHDSVMPVQRKCRPLRCSTALTIGFIDAAEFQAAPITLQGPGP